MISIKPEDLLEPTKIYKSVLKNAFHDNAVEYFDEMVKKSGVNIEKNKEIVKEYHENEAERNNFDKQNKGKKVLRGFMIAFIVIFFVAAGVLIALGATNKQGKMGMFIAIGVVCALLAIGLIVINAVVIKKKIKELTEKVAHFEEVMEQKKNEALAELQCLFAQYDWNMPVDVMNKTTPLIQLDQCFDPEKYAYLHDLYGYVENDSIQNSIDYIQSGSILGNPFVVEKNYVQSMHDHVYTGTLVISWTTTESDGNGGTRTVHHTQTLTAHKTAPEPGYEYETYLIYGNGAAPDLTFSRGPTVTGMSEKEFEKHVKSFEKKLKKVADDAVSKGKTFTPLQNIKFEAAFNALNRDNETQFRLLFTPLAQINMVQLLTDNTIGYGDDFSFVKDHCLNIIYAQHAQGTSIFDGDPAYFKDFDFEVCRDTFIEYIDVYTKTLFFLLAPLTSIPQYQNYKAKEYIYKNTYHGTVTNSEIESCANGYRNSCFAHPKSATPCILKVVDKQVRKDGDHATIRAYSFEGIERLDLIPVMGGDGYMHQVPVHWIEYIRIDNDTPFYVKRVTETLPNINLNENINGNYQKRFITNIEK